MDSLQNLKDVIENLPKCYQVEVLRLIVKDKNVTINENKNGIFINLSDIPDSLTQQLKKYISFVEEQLQILNNVDKKQAHLEKEYFNASNV
tara:strand:- start:161 stop:433 length:273 start_codon:yes stop_codon:yes gene_type:complete